MELRLLRISDVVQMFKIHRNTIRNWERAGILSGKRIGRLVFYEARDVQALLNDKPSREEIDNPNKRNGVGQK